MKKQDALTNTIRTIPYEKVSLEEASDCFGLYSTGRVISPICPVVIRQDSSDGPVYQEAHGYSFLLNSVKFPGLARTDNGRLVLTLSVELSDGRHEMIIFSDDSGLSWSQPRRIDMKRCRPVNLGGSKLMIYNCDALSVSDDGGETWSEHEPIPKLPDGRPVYTDVCYNPLVEGGIVTFIFFAPVEPGYSSFGADPDYWQKGELFTEAVLWTYNFNDHIWGTPSFFPKEWGLNEGSVARAKNGNLVIAFRTQMLGVPIVNDHDMGLATIFSSDNGMTWSDPARHFLFGCHHCSIMNFDDGRLLMTYAARIGELDGQIYHGVEAVLSNDNGVSWDWERRFILFRCPLPNTHSPQSVCLSDGSILTVIMNDTSFSWTEDGKPVYPRGKNFVFIGNVSAVIWRS